MAINSILGFYPISTAKIGNVCKQGYQGEFVKKVHYTPIPPALIAIGILALIVAAVGVAGFGSLHQWWSVGTTLSHLDQVASLSMALGGGIGGISCLIGGVICRVLEHQGKVLEITKKCQNGFQKIGALYPHINEDVICDFAYSNPDLGFGLVVDGTGHDNSRMSAGIKAHFEKFIPSYIKGLPKCESKDDLVQYFEDKMIELSQQFNDPDLDINKTRVSPPKLDPSIPANEQCIGTFQEVTYKPAMSFVQSMRVKDKQILLTAHAGDTSIIVEMEDGSLRKAHSTLTSCGVGWGMILAQFDITGAKRVMGFSDGFGHFHGNEGQLQNKFRGIESKDLFEALKELAIENGANERQDDLSLFVLDL